MKKITIIIVLILFFSCNTEKKSDFFEIKLTEKTVVEISPDSIQMLEMKKEYGEENFYTATDDIMWYSSEMYAVIDSLHINHILTDKRKVRITTPKGQMEINNDTSKTKWRYFYFNGEEVLEKNVFDIINLKE